jgi:membrane peptidoglycan carboxypeptidase
LVGKNRIYDLYSNLGFYKYPDFIIPGPQINDPAIIDNIKAAAIGQENVHLTPLQMVLAASAISSGGEIPSPLLALSYQLSNGSWTLLESKAQGKTVFSRTTTDQVSTLLAIKDNPAWGVVGQALSSSTQTITWFVGGTNMEWKGVPVAFVVLLEKDDPALAYQIGLSIIHQVSSLQPK